MREAAGLLLRRHGWRMLTAADPEAAWSVLAAEPVDAVLLDLNFTRGAVSGEEGLKGLRALMAHDPDMVVVVVTGHSGINVAVAAMRAGAADFVMKPWSNDRLIATLSDALDLRRRRMEASSHASTRDDGLGEAEPILGGSAAMARLRHLIERAGAARAPVLIHGGPGDGKDMVARALHRQAGGAEPMVKIDLTVSDAAQLVQAAPPQATVLLDRLEEADGTVQLALLGALERRADLRTISASRLGAAALYKSVRQDLLYRLNVIEIDIPPLNTRPEDVLSLARHYLALFARRHGKPARPLSEDAAGALVSAAWPGGARELRTRMERAVLLGEGREFDASDFDLQPGKAGANEAPPPPSPSLAQTERVLVEAALKRHNFNVSRAAVELGLTRAALYRRMAKHGL